MRLAVSLAASLLGFPWLAPSVEFKDMPPDLSQVKRIYIDQIGGGKNSDQMRDMIITALQNSKLFAITENPERADAFLRGSADDKIYEEEHSSSDSIGLHANAGSSDGTHNYSSGTSSSSSHGLGITDSESSHTKERRHETSASIRLVNADGDVLWSTTQESSGGKFRGAMADVADRVARQLVEDTRKARAAH
ncbi:MAG TPA: hypothetical protein VK789_20055 [Bryobacteraceae bacterium]|nr:hypothetical protein [Bryobacteraceae bacterium]